MTLVGWLQIALTLALVVVCAIPLSHIIAGAYAGDTKLSHARARAGRARLLSAGGRRSGARAGLVRLHNRDGRLFRRRFPFALRLAAPAELSAAEPARLRRRRARSRLQHLFQLHHQYELAELQRRDDDEPSHPDARAHRAQLRLGGDGPRHGVRAGARASRARRRRRSAISGSTSRGSRSTSSCRSRSSARSPSSRSACRRRSPARSMRRPSKAQSRLSRSVRSPARRSSRSSAPTAAASSTPTPPIRSRTLTPGPICSKSSPCS